MGCPITWWSRRQRSIAASTTEAEYFAAALASREGVYARDFVDSVRFPVTWPTIGLPLCSLTARQLWILRRTLWLSRRPSTYSGMHTSCVTGSYDAFLRPSILNTTQQLAEAGSQLADILTKGLRVEPHRALLDRLLPVVPDDPEAVDAE